jgi:hypothetical protein
MLRFKDGKYKSGYTEYSAKLCPRYMARPQLAEEEDGL